MGPTNSVWPSLLCGTAVQRLTPDHSGFDLVPDTLSPDGGKQAGPWCEDRQQVCRGQPQHRSAHITVTGVPVLARQGSSQSCSGRPQHGRLALPGIQSPQLPTGGTFIISPAVANCADAPGLKHSTAACHCQLMLGAFPCNCLLQLPVCGG